MYSKKEVARRAEILYHPPSTGQPRTDGALDMREVLMMDLQPKVCNTSAIGIHHRFERETMNSLRSYM